MRCRSHRNCQSNGNERIDRHRDWLADRQTDSSLPCLIPPVLSHGMLQVRHHFLSRLSVSVTHPLQSRAKLSKQRRRAGGGNWISPLKDRPPNPHQQELRESAVHQVSSAKVVRPIRFLRLHTPGLHTWVRTRTCQDADRRADYCSHANTRTLTHTNRWIHAQSNKCNQMHTVLPLLSAPALASTINNLRHCGACDPVTFDFWS